MNNKKKKYETYSFLISKMDVSRSWDAKSYYCQ